MNIDFSSEPLFSIYALLLMASGVALVVLASPAFARAGMKLRVFNALVGLAFFGYGFYLVFVFGGGAYAIFFKAFIVPVLLAVSTLRRIVAAKSGATAVAPIAYPAPANPALAYPAPAYPAPANPAPSYPAPADDPLDQPTGGTERY